MRVSEPASKVVRAREPVALLSILILVMKASILLLLLPPSALAQDGRKTGPSKRAELVLSEQKEKAASPTLTKRYALIIGIDKYQETTNLTGAVNDAELLADTLVNYAGFPKENVVLLTSRLAKDSQPTRPNILEKLSAIQEKIPADGNALLVVAFAGHGMERIQGKSYLIPSDAKTRSPQLLEDTAIGIEFLKQRILETGVRQVVLILDSCRNTPQGRRFAENTLLPESIPDEVTFSGKNQNINAFVTLFATSPNKSAYEDQSSNPTHGYYTLALVEALRGKAANENREVTVGRVIAYLEKEVPKRVKKDYDADQRPHKEIYGGQRAENLVLSEADPVFDPEAMLAEGKPFEGELNGEEERVFQMPLQADRRLYFEFRAKGIDAFVSFESPERKELVNSVSVGTSADPAPLFLVTPQGGTYRLKLRTPKTRVRGTYTIKFLAYRQSNPGDVKRIVAQQALDEAEGLAFSAVNRPEPARASLYERSLKKFDEAIALWDEARKLQAERQDYEGEIKARRRMGDVYRAQGADDKSLEAYQKALLLYRSLEDKNGEAVMHILISQVYLRKGNPQEAQISLDKATDTLQINRQPSEFEKRVRATADLLLQLERKAEAEPWLALLNETSLQKAADVQPLSALAKLTSQESDALKRFLEASDRITEIGEEFRGLDDKQRQGPLTPEEQKRLAELSKQLAAANTSFHLFLEETTTELSPATMKTAASLQSDIRQLGEGTVAIYTVVGENGCHIILTTPNVQVARRTEIKAIELNRKVLEFRAALQHPSADPKPLAKELYDILVRPIERDLKGANARTLMWSLDGTLRYIPIAALFDGQQYMVEKYANTLLTTGSLASLFHPPKLAWNVLALGTTKPMSASVAGTKLNFGSLPGVESELRGIVKTGAGTNSTGVFPGTILLDEALTKSSMLSEMWRDYNVIHLAAHFSLREDLDNSFFVLGDGSILTLEELRDSPGVFRRVELLVLSNSSTAFSNKDTSGREVESFSYFAQQLGAKSVLMSLWNGSDESISILLREFYRQRASSSPPVTKAEALRRAQLAVMRREEPERNLRAHAAGDLERTFDHPFYWAGFVLFGNWR